MRLFLSLLKIMLCLFIFLSLFAKSPALNYEDLEAEDPDVLSGSRRYNAQTHKISQCNNDVECLVKLINQATEDVSTFRPSPNATQYIPSNSKTKDFGEFDFIVVGAGSSGTVLTNRLSEYRSWRILLLEAGTYGSDLTDIPDIAIQNVFSSYNWNFDSVPQTTCCLGLKGKRCPYYRGRGIGGSTLINGLVYSRGSAEDFDKWRDLGNPGWSYKDVLPLFRKSERLVYNEPSAPIDSKYHGQFGQLNNEIHLPRMEQHDYWIDANRELGYRIADYNGKHATGVSPAQSSTMKGRRWDGGTAFIEPIKQRKNLKIMTEAYVTKVNLCAQTNKASGVTFSYRNQLYVARASKEVILSAGSIQSAQILMLSGIGPRAHLESFDIPVLNDLEVGSKLIDHPSFTGFSFETNYTVPELNLTAQVQQYLKGYGPLTAPYNNRAVAFYPSSFSTSPFNPDFEVMFRVSQAFNPKFTQKFSGMTDETYQAIWGSVDPNSAIEAFLIGLHPESTGSVRLQSNDPYIYPLIDPRMFSDKKNKDIQVIYEAIQLVLKLMNTRSMKRINATLHTRVLPACRQHTFMSKPYWYCVIRQVSTGVFHPINTCSMGPNPQNGSVVDHELKVHGITGLRVADASVIPLALSGHPNAVCVMIGEKASLLIKKEYIPNYTENNYFYSDRV